MTPDEYSALLSETETSIDRLHALYEQWFMGIERREPLKQREVIQKRLDMFRTNMPRNTALRFRTQNLLSRWVTMSHHWTKISRQIEEGTFKRDVQKAKRKLEQLRASEAKKTPSAKSGKAAEAQPAKESPNPNALSGWDVDMDALDDAFDRVKDSQRPAAPMPSPAAVPAAEHHSAFDDEGAAAIVAPRFTGGARAAGAPAVAPPTSVVRPAALGAPMSAPGAPSRPGPPAPAAPARPVPPPAPSAPSATTPDDAAARAPRTGPKVPPPPLPPGVGAAPARPAPPAPPAPAAPARPAPPAPPARPAPPVASGPDVRQLYDRYVEARRQNNERVDNIKYEAVAASIEKMLPDLQKKHAGKSIDFEVVVKDGRVGFKPVPK